MKLVTYDGEQMRKLLSKMRRSLSHLKNRPRGDEKAETPYFVFEAYDKKVFYEQGFTFLHNLVSSYKVLDKASGKTYFLVSYMSFRDNIWELLTK